MVNRSRLAVLSAIAKPWAWGKAELSGPFAEQNSFRIEV